MLNIAVTGHEVRIGLAVARWHGSPYVQVGTKTLLYLKNSVI
ncbi:hypothetical protein [Occallatibacter savannae]|nr:hypothetical protein [Occallatibacter savannae]